MGPSDDLAKALESIREPSPPSGVGHDAEGVPASGEILARDEAGALDAYAKDSIAARAESEIRKHKAEAQAAEAKARLQRAFCRTIELQNEQLAQDRSERQNYAKRIYRVVTVWLGVVGVLLLAQGLSFPRWKPWASFDLPVPIMLATIGSTTATVIGIFIVVVNYLFYRGKTGGPQGADKSDSQAAGPKAD